MHAVTAPPGRDAPGDLAGFDPRSGSLLERAVFNHRLMVVLACALVTLLLAAMAASKLRFAASFEKMIPRSHPFIQNYLAARRSLEAATAAAAG